MTPDRELADCLQMAEKLARGYAGKNGPFVGQYEEDFVQEARYAVLLAWETFEPERGWRFSTWCTQPIRWRLMWYRRTLLRHPAVSLNAPLFEGTQLQEVFRDPADVAGGVVSRIGAAQAIGEAWSALSERRREVLHAMYWDGVPPVQLAARDGVAPQAIHHVHKRALVALRARLEENETTCLRALAAAEGRG